jgi:Type IV secretion system pilin
MDVIQQLANMGNEFVSWMQILGVVGAAIAFGIGGFQQIFGGAEGLRKAKPWYIGAAVGLIFILGASAIAGFLKMKITF